MENPRLALIELYTLIGSQQGAATDEQCAEVERLEYLINPSTPFVYRCSNCGSEFCEDEGQSWDCAARAGGWICPEDC